MIAIQDSEAYNLFLTEEFECVDRHLTIDDTYSKETTFQGMNGYTYAHYTEKYKHLHKEEYIKVHVYFNQQGRFINIQVRNPENALISVSDKHNALVKKNAQAAQIILMDLLTKKSVKFKAISQLVNQVGDKLQSSSYMFHDRQERENYIIHGVQFIEAINKLNDLSDDEPDGRGSFIANVIKKLQSWPERSLLDIETADESLNPIDKVVTDFDSLSFSGNDPFSELLKNILQLEAEWKAVLKAVDQDTGKAILALKLTQQLRDQVLELSLMEMSSSQKEIRKRKLVKRITESLSNGPNFSDELEKAFLAGDFDYFKKVFLLNTKALWFMTLFDFMTGVTKEPCEKLRGKRIEILDFLYEHSEQYRQAIPTFSKMLIEFVKEEGLYISPLFSAIVCENENVVLMLIRHGYDVNENGLHYQGTIISNLRAALFWCADEKYIKLLLDNDAVVDRPFARIDTHLEELKGKSKRDKEISERAKADLPIVLEKLYKKIGGNPNALLKDNLVRAFDKRVTDLWLCMFYQRYEITLLLAEQSNILSLALALAAGANFNQVASRRIPTDMRSGTEVVSSKQECDIITQQALANFQLNGPKNKLKNIIYFRNENKIAFKAYKVLAECLYSRCNDRVTLCEFLLKPKLEAYGKAYAEEGNIHFSRNCFEAGQYLIYQKDNLRVSDMEELIRFAYYNANNFSKSSNPVIKSAAPVFFSGALQLSKFSSHTMEIENRPLYKAVQAQFMKC